MEIRKPPFLAPVAFTIVMGTGALSIATLEMARAVPFLYWCALSVTILNYVLFCLLAAWAFMSWPQNCRTLVEHFDQPDTCALYSAAGIALLVLGAQALRFGFGEFMAIGIWSMGAILTFFLNYGILLRFFLHPGVEMAHITPVFFVPVAGLVVIPVAGAPICGLLDGFAKDLVSMFCLFALGGGLALYMGIFGMMLQRHIMFRPLPDNLAPTLWIHLAPIGWAAVSLLALGKNVFPQSYFAAVQVIALLLFGAAIWWLVMAAIICLRALFQHNLPFHLGWWSFIFPIGSVTILSGNLDFGPARIFFPWLWTLLAALWIFCAVKTVIFLRRKSSSI